MRSQQQVQSGQRYPAGGVYDKHGFYIYPDGSFVDPDGYFFNQYGVDEFGGYYDNANRYHKPPHPQSRYARGYYH